MEFLNNRFGKENVKKIIYVTDGAGSQYKNQYNFGNIYYHYNDFGVKCEWHFHATAHGKCCCDGVGGNVKRMARRESLVRKPSDAITTPLQLYEWAIQAETRIEFCFVDTIEYEIHENEQKERYKTVRPVPNTRKIHCIIPAENGQIGVKLFSNQSEISYVPILKKQ